MGTMALSIFNALVMALLSGPRLQLDQVQPTAAELAQREADKEKSGGETDGSWASAPAQEAPEQPKKLDSRWQYWSNIPR
jgi:hypothetical protein